MTARAVLEEEIRRLLGAPAGEVVAWGVTRFGRKLAIASSFSIEDCVVIDLASKAARAAKADGVRVFALDTGRLPDETYMTAERVRMKYGVEIEWLFPERAPVEQLIRLKGLDAWVTGLRSEQSVTRSDTPAIEIDDAHRGIAKLNPIVCWSAVEVRAYA